MVYCGKTYAVLRESFKIEQSTVTAFAAISSGYALQSLNNLKLLLTRGYEGRYHVQKETLDLHEAVETVMDELSEIAAASQICLFNRVPGGSTICADQSLMTQLLINLIGNGIKYGVRGGCVTVEAARSKQNVI